MAKGALINLPSFVDDFLSAFASDAQVDVADGIVVDVEFYEGFF